MLDPGTFIPLAERTGLIGPITRWVFREVLRQWTHWHQQGMDLRISVNLSPRSLRDEHLVSMIDRQLDAWQVDPSNLQVEVTEAAVMQDPDHALFVLIQLRDRGIRIAIDDFGMGQSSLAYLRQLPADEIEIDRSFVRSITHDRNDAVIVRSIIDLAHNLGLQVAAEGAEDQRIVDMLIGMGCDLVQGYHLMGPLPPDALERWLIDGGIRATA
jgi:EAL domain-containing protein (putative c-di-GMP-specific phosphodiesterase class I)